MENMTVYPKSREYNTYVWTILRRQESPYFAERLRRFRLKQFKVIQERWKKTDN